MKLIRRRPGVAYLSNTLWLPKTHISEMQLRSSLTYDMGQYKAPLEAWSEERDHWVVPRNYIVSRNYTALPFPLVDARLRSYPQVRIKSRAVLDGRDPASTYQRDGSAALFAAHDGILCLRCGAGKTVISIHTAVQLQVPVLVIVPDLGIAEQWSEELLQFTDLTKSDIGLIGDGEFTWKKPFVIGLVQSLARRAKDQRISEEVTRHFGILLCDETHSTAGAPFFGSAIPPFHGRRWGLSATPTRNDQFDSLLRYTIGQVEYTYLMPELIPTTYFRRMYTRLDTSRREVAEAVNDRTGELHLKKLYGYLATCEDRTKIIVSEIREALKRGRHVLVLSQSRAALDRFAKDFPEAGVIHSGVKSRAERLRRIRECNPVIAIDTLGKQALNKPSLDTLILCEPFSEMNVIQQIFGRVQRMCAGKQAPMVVVYDEIYIQRLHKICVKIRSMLNRWPARQGSKMPWVNVN